MFLPAGFGGYLGRALRAGETLVSGTQVGGDAPLRVVAGPQAGQFDDGNLAVFLAGNYRVGEASAVAARGWVDRRDPRGQGVLPGAVPAAPDVQPLIPGWAAR